MVDERLIQNVRILFEKVDRQNRRSSKGTTAFIYSFLLLLVGMVLAAGVKKLAIVSEVVFFAILIFSSLPILLVLLLDIVFTQWHRKSFGIAFFIAQSLCKGEGGEEDPEGRDFLNKIAPVAADLLLRLEQQDHIVRPWKMYISWKWALQWFQERGEFLEDHYLGRQGVKFLFLPHKKPQLKE